MLTDEQRIYVAKTAQTLQIIIGALISGVLILATIVVLRGGGELAEDRVPMLTIAGVVFAVAGAAASLVVPKLMDAAFQKAHATGQPTALPQAAGMPTSLGEPGQWLAFVQTRTIIAAALLEGPAFLNAIAYMIEGQSVSLMIVAALLFCLAMLFPTVDRLTNWISVQIRRVEEQRQLASRT